MEYDPPYNDEQIKAVEDVGKTVPVFFSYNMSIGVSLLCELSKVAAKVLGNGFDVEIVEAHHNQKLDAPSGTAIMLGNAIKEEMPDATAEEIDAAVAARITDEAIANYISENFSEEEKETLISNRMNIQVSCKTEAHHDQQGKHQEGRSRLFRRSGYVHHHSVAEGEL